MTTSADVREAAAKIAEQPDYWGDSWYRSPNRIRDAIAAAIRAMPLPEAPKDMTNEQVREAAAKIADAEVMRLQEMKDRMDLTDYGRGALDEARRLRDEIKLMPLPEASNNGRDAV